MEERERRERERKKERGILNQVATPARIEGLNAKRAKQTGGAQAVSNKVCKLPVEFIARLISGQITRLTMQRPARDSLL